MFETEYLGNRNCYRKKLSSVPREGNRDYFVAQIGMKSHLRRSKSCEKNSIPYSRSSPAAHNTFSAGYVCSTARPCGRYPVTLTLQYPYRKIALSNLFEHSNWTLVYFPKHLHVIASNVYLQKVNNWGEPKRTPDSRNSVPQFMYIYMYISTH